MIPAQALQRLIDVGDRLQNNPSLQENHSAWENAKKELLEVFEGSDLDNLRVILGNVLLAKINAGGVKGTYFITNGDLERALVKVRQRYTLPIVMDQVDLDQVLHHIFRWKMQSAYDKANVTIGFPSDALQALQLMADSYGDCGYQQGKIFEPLKKSIKEITAMLHYEFDESRSNTEFVRRQTVPA